MSIGRRRVDMALALTGKGWLASAGTASAMLAIIGCTLVAGCATPASQRASTTVSPDQRSVPRYYVTLDISGPITTFGDPVAVATVRVTTTGAAIDRISAPRPYKGFTAVTGAADDRTFVLVANAPTNPFTGVTPERFFVLRIDPGAPSAAEQAQLTPLSVLDIPGGQGASNLIGEQVGTMALSPDARSLAAILALGDKNYLYVYNLATRKAQSWVREPCSGCRTFAIDGMATLSWTSDSRSLALPFTFGPRGPDLTQLRLLHLSSLSSNVQASSTPVDIHAPETYWQQAVMTPDGKAVFLKFILPGANYSLGSFSLMRFSLATGQLATINKLPMVETAGYANSGPLTADTILWTNEDGSKVIVADARPGHTLGVYNDGRYTPLPWPAHAVGAAW